MVEKAKPKAPAGLGSAAKALWRSVVGSYELRADERRLLEDACRECDLVAKLEAAQADAPMMVRGSQGQQVISPYIAELRQHRGVLAGLLKGLHLPDESATDQAERRRELASDLGRRAARARWDRRDYGTGA
jgi:hypothetical protein